LNSFLPFQNREAGIGFVGNAAAFSYCSTATNRSFIIEDQRLSSQN